MANQGALAKFDVDAAIERIANGAILKEFAQEYGCSVVAVHKRLKQHPEYQDAIAVATHNQVQVTTKALMECERDSESVNLARARARHALDVAKVRNPDYADKREQLNINVDASIDHADLARRIAFLAEQQAIDGEFEQIPQSNILQRNNEGE